ncbi:hypothetical protein, partial [Aeromonas aquatica]|uniref:hypothetical protein n=1 Tax=Aeromonas aquatica TaxID=558964 RepID=UPI001EE6DDAF
SGLEIEIMNDMLKLDKPQELTVINNCISRHLPKNSYVKVNSKTDVLLYISSTCTDINELHTIDRTVSTLIITTILLVEFLKKNKFIFFNGRLDLSTIGEEFNEDQHPISCDFIDDDLKENIYNFTTQKFFITEDFKTFVNKGYKTKEDIEKEQELNSSKNQLFYTRIALFVTFSSLIASVLIPLYSTTSVKLENKFLNISSSKQTTQYINDRLKEQKAENEKSINELKISLLMIDKKVEGISKQNQPVPNQNK